MVDTRVNLSGLILDNPVIPASGTFGYGEDFHKYFELSILGSISIKGTTKQPRYGNPLPRIAESSSGLLNAVGLQNPGIKEVLEEKIPFLEKHFQKKLIANVCGFSKEEYIEVAKAFDQSSAIGLLEINISCPNVDCGGMAIGTDPDLAYQLTKEIKANTKKPVYMKLSPNVTDITEIALACEEGGADGLSMVNTFLGMRLDLKKRKPLLANRTGGLSGPAIFPLALRMVWDTYEKVSIPIIGMGGISTCDDILEMMMAGASAIQIGAQNLVHPTICQQLIKDLPKRMEMYGITSLQELVGSAHERKKNE